MNFLMHHDATGASDISRTSGNCSHDPWMLDRVSKLLTSHISKSDEDYESARLKASIGIALFKYVMRYGQGDGRYFNRDRLVTSGHNMIWCVIDDAKFQQGSVLEKVALAGCWKLKNLCVIHDGIGGAMSPNLDLSKFKKHGWNVIEVVNDNNLTISDSPLHGPWNRKKKRCANPCQYPTSR
ncbi:TRANSKETOLASE-1 domain-containing protein [Fusarium keratoplasticum]|nr:TRANSKETOLASE-1 domain-containing protein [Fusarium keratoplasticum]